jgi:hypothetical protein
LAGLTILSTLFKRRRYWWTSSEDDRFQERICGHPNFKTASEDANMSSSIPFTTFTGFLKRIDVTNLTQEQQKTVEVTFTEFFDKPRTNPFALSASRGTTHFEAPFQYRRFAGDATLSRGSYYTLCSDEQGDDSETLAHELMAYVNPEVSGEVDVADLRSPRYRFLIKLYNDWLFHDGSAPTDAIAVPICHVRVFRHLTLKDTAQPWAPQLAKWRM